MLKKAVDAHSTTGKYIPTAPNRSSMQLGLISSGSQKVNQLHPQLINSHPLMTIAGNATKSPTLVGRRGTDDVAPQARQGHGIKRTLSGLEKALGNGNSFEDTAYQRGTWLQDPIVVGDVSPESKPGLAKRANQVYFDENDFDSDLDLDVEDPAFKTVIAYPSLPMDSVKGSEAAHHGVPAPEPARRAHPDRGNSRHISVGLGHEANPYESTIPIPWSSSPVEHRQPISKVSTIRQYVYNDTNQLKPVPAPANPPRPSTWRTLPWLEDVNKSEPGNVPSDADSRAIRNGKQNPSLLDSSVTFTPLPKENSKSSHPWNTTASAMKEQQKLLRKSNKKLVKANEGDGESIQAAKSNTSKRRVRRPFLSDEQQHVLNLVIESRSSVFFTGSAGTGKSVLLREIIAALRKKYEREPDRVAVTASTGLAACNVGGVTLHSFAGIGLGKDEVDELVKKIKRNQKTKHRWMRTKVLIIDEISMVDGDLFDKLEEIARRMRNNGRPFGGIQLVITGDFFQLPPVPDGNRVSKFAFDAGTWNTSIEHTIGLHRVFRQKDPVFAGMLNEMREGRLTQKSIDTFRKLSRPLKFEDEMTATELSISPSFSRTPMLTGAPRFPTRHEVDGANNSRMRQLCGDVRVFEARDGGTITDGAMRTKLLQNCMAPQLLELKKGAQVMLIKNIDETLVNGSLGKIIGFMDERTFDAYNNNEEQFHMLQSTEDEDLNPSEQRQKMKINSLGNTTQTFPLVRFVISDGTTRELLCIRETWKVELPNGEVQASRSQVPLILAWALSIHKAQGQTLERVKVDLGKVFEKGQAYVALSRATSMDGLQVLRFDPKKVVAHDRVGKFYASLSTAEGSGIGDAGASKGGKRKGGITTREYENHFVGSEFDYDGDGDLMSAYA